MIEAWVNAMPRAQSRDPLINRMLVAVALSIPVLALSMIPALQFHGWGWVAGILTTPVALWSAWPFHRSAWLALKHRNASMDTLISLGVLTAYSSSVAALLGLGSAPRRSSSAPQCSGSSCSRAKAAGGGKGGSAVRDGLQLLFSDEGELIRQVAAGTLIVPDHS
jgi:hypothetical protein